MYLGKIYKGKERELRVADMESAPETEATIKIRLLTPGERRGLMMSSFKTTYTPDDNGAMKSEMLSEHYKLNEHIFIKAVVGWAGFYEDEEGNIPLKFGHAGKTKLLSIVPELADFVAESHGEMVKEEEEARETVEKNLSSGLSESKKSRTAQSAKA